MLKMLLFVTFVIFLLILNPNQAVQIKTVSKLQLSLKSGLEGLLKLKSRKDIFENEKDDGSNKDEVESLIQRNEEKNNKNN